jgi:hypothetical protein
MSDNGGDRPAEIDQEEQKEEVNAVAMEAIRQALCGTTLKIGERGDDVKELFVNARSFAKLSQGNDTVEEVTLVLEIESADYELLRVLGKGLGNLTALRVLTVFDSRSGDNLAEDLLYWQAFAGALSQVRQPIEFRLDGSWHHVNFTNFAVAMQGVSTIRTFRFAEHAILWEDANAFISALAILPSLEKVTLGDFINKIQDVEVPGLTNLLKAPSMRSIEFYKMGFERGLSWALAAGFEEGSFVTDLRFTNCYAAYEGDDGCIKDQQASTHKALVQILQRKSSVKCLSLVGNDFDELFCSSIASILLVNTILVDLTLHTDATEQGGRWLQSLFVAMRTNVSLKRLDVNDLHLTDEVVCGAMRDMLAKNSVLESLSLHPPENLDEMGEDHTWRAWNVDEMDEDQLSWRTSYGGLQHFPDRLAEASLVSWRKTLPFIRDNATLKSLTFFFNGDEIEPHVATLCFDTVAMLKGNTTLEYLHIKSNGITSGAYISALESLQPSSTLKTLRLSPIIASMGEEEMNQVVSLVEKNYSLAILDDGLSARDKTGELGTLLRLNQAGRRYLIEDAASIAKGVEVLIGVSDHLGCLFYHLLENPTLCDIEHQYDAKSETGKCAHSNKRQRIQS